MMSRFFFLDLDDNSRGRNGKLSAMCRNHDKTTNHTMVQLHVKVTWHTRLYNQDFSATTLLCSASSLSGDEIEDEGSRKRFASCDTVHVMCTAISGKIICSTTHGAPLLAPPLFATIFRVLRYEWSKALNHCSLGDISMELGSLEFSQCMKRQLNIKRVEYRV